MHMSDMKHKDIHRLLVSNFPSINERPADRLWCVRRGLSQAPIPMDFRKKPWRLQAIAVDCSWVTIDSFN